jgi:class 3 adenylate cyclase
MSEQRRLAAILVADVVGYSRLVGQDEAGTLAGLAALRRDVIEPTIARHAGRLFKAVGDGFLVEFVSAVQAVATLDIEVVAAVTLSDSVSASDAVLDIEGGFAMRMASVLRPPCDQEQSHDRRPHCGGR